MIPSQQGMMLEAAMAFEHIIKNPKSSVKTKVQWREGGWEGRGRGGEGGREGGVGGWVGGEREGGWHCVLL